MSILSQLARKTVRDVRVWREPVKRPEPTAAELQAELEFQRALSGRRRGEPLTQAPKRRRRTPAERKAAQAAAYRKWARSHPSDVKLRNKTYKDANREKMRAASKAYREKRKAEDPSWDLERVRYRRAVRREALLAGDPAVLAEHRRKHRDKTRRLRAKWKAERT